MVQLFAIILQAICYTWRNRYEGAFWWSWCGPAPAAGRLDIQLARGRDAATGQELARMQHDGEIYAVAFSPDGRWVVSGSYDGTARMWLWQPEDLIAEACHRLPRNLTYEEWTQYIGPDVPYHATCPELPVPEE